MKSRASPSAQSLSLAVLLLAVCAGGVFWGLAAYSQPEGFANRVSSLQERVDEITRLSQLSPTARAYVPGQLCAGSSEEVLAGVAASMQGEASQQGLQVVNFNLSPPAELGDTVARVDFQSEYAGSYDAASRFLTAASAGVPRLFVDRVDLTDRASAVSLRFAGHFYCSTAN
jgi:hypothetical protein